MPVRGQRRELEERAARVEQRVDPLAGQQLAAVDVPRAGALTAALGDLAELLGEIGDERGMRRGVAGGRVGIDRQRPGRAPVHPRAEVNGRSLRWSSSASSGG